MRPCVPLYRNKKLKKAIDWKSGDFEDAEFQREMSITCEQFPLSNVVSFDDQQHCSRFNQNASGQMPNFKSVIQLAPISIIPATQPDAKPTSNTHTQPDHASCAPYSQLGSPKELVYLIFFFFIILALNCKRWNSLLKNPMPNFELFSLYIDVSFDLWLCLVANRWCENLHIARFPEYHRRLYTIEMYFDLNEFSKFQSEKRVWYVCYSPA